MPVTDQQMETGRARAHSPVRGGSLGRGELRPRGHDRTAGSVGYWLLGLGCARVPYRKENVVKMGGRGVNSGGEA